MATKNPKQRLFEVMQRVNPEFKGKLNEDISTLPTSDKKITTTFATVSPESAENGDYEETGWKDEEGESMVPDEYDAEDGVTAIDKAVEFLKKNGASEPSSSPQFNVGVWYSTPDGEQDYSSGITTYYSFHLKGFTPEEEMEIYKRITGR